MPGDRAGRAGPASGQLSSQLPGLRAGESGEGLETGSAGKGRADPAFGPQDNEQQQRPRAWTATRGPGPCWGPGQRASQAREAGEGKSQHMGQTGGGEGSALHLLHARGRLRFSTREAQGGKQKAQGSQGPACRACLLPPPPRRPPPPGHSRSLAARPSPFALRPPRVSWGPGQRAAGCAWRRSRHCVTSQEPRLSTALPVVTEGELGCKLGCGHYTEATYRAPGGFTRSHGTRPAAPHLPRPTQVAPCWPRSVSGSPVSPGAWGALCSQAHRASLLRVPE